MLSAGILESRLNALYNQLEGLRPDSSDAELVAFASFFAQDCVVNFESMREAKEPSLGRDGVVAKLRDQMKHLYLEQRTVVSQVISESDMRVFSEMRNRYNVHSEVLDDFPETLVATFDDEGLITNFSLYGCRSHILIMIQKATGNGPFSAEEMTKW
ncbi:hypothetical protein TRIATDRAFT_84644 [Trichoderma atroviride IMI 206040]|uniref:SnoaL-like domain-containing protein n=1 Tax=Hypocrea atroviridis (strain ATCC 20476 / IMI 206040) TaxID=452589 RepID=G9P7B4_HYPAI|nr:uncharacterized protein TRIATDRAFT_84644 [Trichoderma atroviride IMI 206040]EHK41562.1 hypothetical protein TRIATDRAFT_84644 [Trichoderma atroviride IMI 206040]